MTFEMGETFEMKAGQVARIKGENYHILFMEVKEDSRCPKGANCVWEGQTIVKLSIRHKGETGNVELKLHAGRSTLNKGTSEPFELTLVSVQPYPVMGEDFDKADYAVQLKVDKGQMTK